jgi:hypothetical protein
MRYSKEENGKQHESGYALVIALFLMALTAFVVREALKRAGSSSTIVSASRVVAGDTVDVEVALNKAISFMRDNSSQFAYLFSYENFYSNFERVDTPSYGTNDLSTSQIASKIFVRGSSDVPLLANDPDLFGYENFPSSIDSATGTGVELVGAFSSIDFGNAKVRITLIDAVGVTPENDTPPTSTTDFKPIWRIDAMAALNRGHHVYAILEGDPQRAADPSTYWGIYGKEAVAIKSDVSNYNLAGCLSYNSAAGAYSTSNRSDGCRVGTQSATTGSSNFDTGVVFGSWQSNFTNSGFLGRVCSSANFGGTCWSSGVRAPGTTTPCTTSGCWCMGSSCVTPPSFTSFYNGASLKTFASVCPTNNGNISDNKESQPLATPGCWNRWTLNRNRSNRAFKIILTGNGDYYVNNIIFAGRNTTSEPSIDGHVYVRANPSPGGVVRLWVWSISGPDSNQKDITWFRNGSSDASHSASGDGKPTSFQLNFMWSTATANLTSNTNIWQPYFSGGPEFKGFLYAPDAVFTVQNNSSFTTIMNGGVYGKAVRIHQPMRYDVAGEATGLSLLRSSGDGGVDEAASVAAGYTGAYDILYTVRQQGQVFR